MSLQEVLINALSLVLIGVIPLLVKWIGQFFVVKTANEKLNNYLNIATDAVYTAISAVSQTVVEQLKSEDGFTKEEMVKALEMAKQLAKKLMGEAALQALAMATDDVDAWLTAKIEAGLYESK